MRHRGDVTTDTNLDVATDVDGVRAQITPLDSAPWPRRDPRDHAHAPTPLVSLEPSGAARAEWPGRVLGNRYRLSRQLGAGGYGAVFAADDLTTRGRVAIKVLTPAASQSAEMITRFHREAIAASRARHPHIVQVDDFDVDDDGDQYIVMEYLDGRDLAAVLASDGALPPARALAIAAQCARGLAAAHRVGVLHRDLKPANVFLVRRDDGDHSVKIIDFGISKLTRAAGDYTDVTSASKVVGTPCYMAPEQARGLALDVRCDVYALGVMLFEMLVGRRPFVGRSALEILSQHLDAPRVRPSRLRPELAACKGLDALVVRAISAAPANRFPSMEHFSEALVECLREIDPAAAERACEVTGELVASGPPTVRDTAVLRRRVARAVGVGALALAILAVVSWPRGADERIVSTRPAEPVPSDPPPLVEPPAASPTPAPRVVRVTSTPSGATVRVGDEVVGVTPFDVVIAPDALAPVITLSAPRHRARSVVLDGEHETIEVALERAPDRVRARPKRPPAPTGAAELGVSEW
jgi:eukaryotic-like serine/threonine-protein kinase